MTRATPSAAPAAQKAAPGAARLAARPAADGTGFPGKYLLTFTGQRSFMNKSVKRALVIDDEALSRKCLRDMLELDGFEVSEAENGLDGLNLFEATDFDIVITDIIMPVKEGIETIRAMLAMKPAANIIAITGGGRVPAEDFLSMALKFGAKHVLAKPISIHDARHVIQQLTDP